MEVLSFISQRSDLINTLVSFLEDYDNLILDYQTDDTLFYISPTTKRYEIYVHFLHNNIEKEFSYNYTQEEQNILNRFFGEKLYVFDIQFRSEDFLNNLLAGYKQYLFNQGFSVSKQVLISHPFKGILNF